MPANTAAISHGQAFGLDLHGKPKTSSSKHKQDSEDGNLAQEVCMSKYGRINVRKLLPDVPIQH